jgi:hypothetical protein
LFSAQAEEAFSLASNDSPNLSAIEASDVVQPKGRGSGKLCASGYALFHRKWLCANDHDYDLGSIVSPVLR